MRCACMNVYIQNHQHNVCINSLKSETALMENNVIREGKGSLNKQGDAQSLLDGWQLIRASSNTVYIQGEPHSWWIWPRVNTVFRLHVICTIVRILLYDEHFL